jgi:hypothetical protein
MKYLVFATLLLAFAGPACAKNADTIKVNANSLNIKQLQTGEFNYLIFFKKTNESIPTRFTLITFNVQPEVYHQKAVFAVTQRWNADTTTHTCYTLFDAKDFSTVRHETYWKRLGYAMLFDFESKKAEFKKANDAVVILDSVKAVAVKDFEQSFERYNLNWHADLIIYSLLSYKANRTFIINFYDPGLAKAEDVSFTVTGSEMLTGSRGDKIDCWVLNHFNNDNEPEKGYERFWISKKTNEVLKSEDYGGKGGGHRYKIKIGVSAG